VGGFRKSNLDIDEGNLDIDEGALDSEFDLTPGWCLWQNQVIVFNMAHAAIKFNFELKKRFIFCAADTEDKGRKCDQWNTLSTKELEEVVASARTNFKWQSSKEGLRLQDCAFKDWLSLRPLALRPIYWEISSDVYSRFKMGYEAELRTEIFRVHC